MMKVINWHYILIIKIAILINLVYTKEVLIKSENDFLNAVNHKNYDELIINNKISINSRLKIDISSLYIKGNSDLSGIHFNEFVEFSNGHFLEFNNVDFSGNVTINYSNVNILHTEFRGNISITRGDNNGGKLNIKHSRFFLQGELERDFMEINNYDTVISHCSFEPSSDGWGSLLKYGGGVSKSYHLDMEESEFNGKFTSRALDVTFGLINIKTTNFINCTSYKNSKGGAVTVYEADFHMNNCLFKDIYCDFDGGGFFISQTNGFIVENTSVFNVTTRRGGGFLYVTATADKSSHATLRNIKHIGSGLENIIDFMMNGVIACVDGYASLDVENYYGENFYTISSVGAAFIGSGDATITIRNLELKKITGGTSYGGGLLITTYNPFTKGVTFDIDNCTMSNILQYSDNACSLFSWVDKGSYSFKNCNIKNAKGSKSHLHYQTYESRVTFNNVSFDSISSNFPTYLINLDATNNNSFLELNNVIISKVSSPGGLYRNNVSILRMNNCEFENIHTCEKSKTCVNYEVGPAIGVTENDGKTYISNTKFINFYGAYGFSKCSRSYTEISNSIYQNCNFDYGIFSANDGTYNSIGTVTVKDSTFLNNNSTSGSILFINKVEKPENLEVIKFENCQFKDNHAVKQGGVVYSISDATSKSVIFDNCEFLNNTAKFGDISYAYHQSSEPKFINIKDILSLKAKITNFVTNPSYIVLDKELTTTDIISTYSGQQIKNLLSYKIYDDYDHIINFNYETLDDVFFYSITPNDTYNVKLFGQIYGFCKNSSCSVSNVKAVGNPGKYKLNFNIITFGQYLYFENSTSNMELEILDCEENDQYKLGNYLYKYRESNIIKSCYKKVCNPSCKNQGECLGNNQCNCKGTKYVGNYCEILKLHERNVVFDNIIWVITIALIFLSLLLIFGVYYYRDNTNIKGGGVEFLIIILIGTIINYGYVLLLTLERNKICCILLFSFYYIGFSLVFGSILAKTYRVYKISQILQDLDSNVSKKGLYGIVIGITFYHLLIIIACVIFNNIDVNIPNEKNNYLSCRYNKIRHINVIFDFLVLIIGSFYAYVIRDFNKTFTEPLTIPVYIYSISSFLIEFVNMQHINILSQDYISSIGILISMMTIIYYLYILKFVRVFSGVNNTIDNIMGIDIANMQRLNSIPLTGLNHSKSDDYLPNNYEPSSKPNTNSSHSQASLLSNTDLNCKSRNPNKRKARRSTSSSSLYDDNDE